MKATAKFIGNKYWNHGQVYEIEQNSYLVKEEETKKLVELFFLKEVLQLFIILLKDF